MEKLYPPDGCARRVAIRRDDKLRGRGVEPCGIVERLIDLVCNPGATGLAAASNYTGTERKGFGSLLRTRWATKIITSYVGENKKLERRSRREADG